MQSMAPIQWSSHEPKHLHCTEGLLRNEVCIRCHSGNLRQRARVDSALDWHHWAVRRGAAGQVWNRVLALMSGQGGSEDVAEASVGI